MKISNLLPLFVALSLIPGSAHAASRYVKSITTVATGDGRVEWAQARNVILYDSLAANGYFNIFSMNPDGSGKVCMTCNNAALPPKHIGNPATDPANNWIVFQVEKASISGAVADYYANPGAGINDDIWIMNWNATQFLQVTNTPLSEGGVLHPHFSNKGDKLIWAQRISSSGSPYGTWTIQVADFSVVNGSPVVSNIRSFAPGAQQQFYETHGFSADDSKIIFSGNLAAGQSVYDIDIYTLDLETNQLVDLTNNNNWNEHAHYSPLANNITWMSSVGLPAPTGPGVQTDFWIMNPDGSYPERLTYFNDPTSPEFIPNVTHVTCADLAWNGDGTKMVASLITSQATYGGAIVVIDFDWRTASVSAASYQPATSTSAITAAFSRGLSIGTTIAHDSTNLPLSLGGTDLTVTDSAGVTRPAQLYFVSPLQVNYVVPAGTATGPATVTVTLNGRLVSTAATNISTIAPGIYTASQSGSGVPVGYYQIVAADGSQTVQSVFRCDVTGKNCVPNPVNLSAGKVFLSLFGTGIRNALQDAVTATVAGIPVPVAYSGLQVTYAGFDQIVLQFPPSLAGAGTANLVVTFAGTAANTVQVGIQ